MLRACGKPGRWAATGRAGSFLLPATPSPAGGSGELVARGPAGACPPLQRGCLCSKAQRGAACSGAEFPRAGSRPATAEGTRSREVPGAGRCPGEPACPRLSRAASFWPALVLPFPSEAGPRLPRHGWEIRHCRSLPRALGKRHHQSPQCQPSSTRHETRGPGRATGSSWLEGPSLHLAPGAPHAPACQALSPSWQGRKQGAASSART